MYIRWAMDRGDIVILAQIGILAIVIYSFQIIFEFIENIVGLSNISNEISYAALIINPIIATIIIGIVYVFWLNRAMPKVIRTYTVLLYVAIQFVLSNINNGYYIESIKGTIFTPLFYQALILSMLVFVIMFFILTSCLDLIPKFILANNNALKQEIANERGTNKKSTTKTQPKQTIDIRKISVTVPVQKKENLKKEKKTVKKKKVRTASKAKPKKR